jgi:hypothetical protein
MRLFHSESILNAAAFENVPVGTTKYLLLRFSGTNQAAQAVTLANLGRLLVNRDSDDKVNATYEMMSLLTNLKLGVAEFSSVTGGAFASSIYVPLHAWWDNFHGMFFPYKSGYVQMDFPAVTATIVASGLVQMFYVSAPGSAAYDTYHLQRNIQVGGAGAVPQEIEFKNISSLFFITNAAITNYQITADKVEYVNSDSAPFLANSNAINRVETAITLAEAFLNPYQEIRAGLNSEVKVQVQATGAFNLNCLAEILVPSGTALKRSVADATQRERPTTVVADSLRQ